MKMTRIEKIKGMLLSRLCAAYASLEKTRAAQKLPKWFHANSATRSIIRSV